MTRSSRYYKDTIADPIAREYYLMRQRDWMRREYHANPETRRRKLQASRDAYRAYKEARRATNPPDPARIKAARIAAGYTLYTAAALLGVKHQVIMAIEHPRRIKPIPDDVLQRLADAYNCDLAAFYQTGDKLHDG